MKQLILTITLTLCLFVGGCNEILAGIGIGVAGSETLNSWEENLLEKKESLLEQYETALVGIKEASDPNSLIFAQEKLRVIQIAQISNETALSVVKEIKYQTAEGATGSPLNLLHALIPIAIAWGGNELRKRKKEEDKRRADKEGRELCLQELAAMEEKDITASVVKALMYKDIGLARSRKA